MRATAIGLLLSSCLWACSSPEPEAAPEESPAASAPVEVPSPESTPTMPVVIDEELHEVAVTELRPRFLPYQMFVPVGTEAEGGCSGEGCGLRLELPAELSGQAGMSLHLFIPAGGPYSAAEDDRYLRELLRNNGWRPTSDIREGLELLAPGVTRRVDFEGPESVGFVLVGDVEGDPVRLIAEAPAASPWLAPLAQIVRGSLRSSDGA
jgi:hypothetical protein